MITLAKQTVLNLKNSFLQVVFLFFKCLFWCYTKINKTDFLLSKIHLKNKKTTINKYLFPVQYCLFSEKHHMIRRTGSTPPTLYSILLAHRYRTRARTPFNTFLIHNSDFFQTLSFPFLSYWNRKMQGYLQKMTL